MTELDDVRIVLSGVWTALMLSYLLGDVIRVFSGDFVAGEMGGGAVSQGMYLGMAVLFTAPILMVVLSLTLSHPLIRWANIIVAIVFFVINIIGLPGYPSLFDKFLNVFGLGLNLWTIWYAWKWV